MLNKLYKSYFLYIVFATSVIFLNYITKPFFINVDAIILIMMGCVIEYFSEDKSFENRFSISKITTSIVILFFNIQTLIVTGTLMWICSVFSFKGEDKNTGLKQLFNKDNIYNLCKTIVIGYLVIKFKNYLSIDFDRQMDAFKVIVVLLIYLFLDVAYKYIYHYLKYGKENEKTNLEYLMYTIIATFFTVYGFQDRGLLVTIPIYIFIIPFQKINTLYFMYKKQEHRANQDELTGLYNSRYLKTELVKRIQNKEQFSLIMLDVNKFKEINDTYGHVAGDEALKTFSNILKKSFRETDIVARYGGDEFCILLDSVNQSNEFINSIKERLNDVLVVSGEHTFSISSSIGVYEHTGGEGDLNFIIGKADKEMYKYKNSRR